MRDAKATRRRILEAARTEFSRYGLAGARINRIAQESGANKERIYANFDSKNGLFEAVMTDTLASHSEIVGGWEQTPENIIDRLRKTHQRTPYLLRLMLWEALELGASPVPDEALRRDYYQTRLDALIETFGFESKAHAGVAILTLIGIAAWPSTMPQLVQMLIPDGDDDAFSAVQDDLMRHLAEAILNQNIDALKKQRT